MENLEDILRKLRDSRPVNGDANHADNGLIVPTEQPEDVCDLCDGRRWLTLDVPVGHPDFGKAQPCQCQAETTASERSARLRRYSNLGVLSRMTFDSANPAGKSESEEGQRMFIAAYEAALAYAEDPAGWLIMSGPNGTGKTHLAAAIANRCIEQGRPVFFVHVPDLLDDLRSTYAPHSVVSYSELFDQVNDAPLLVLDGLGTQSATPWAQEKLQQIFNRRSNAQLPTVVTTSMNVLDIDPYISSRMTNPDLSHILEFPSLHDESAHRLGIIPDDMLRRMTFDTFEMKPPNSSKDQHKSLEDAHTFAKGYAVNLGIAWAKWITFFGSTGVGKTHLAIAIANVCLEQNKDVLFVFVPDLMDYLRSTFHPDSNVAYDRVFNEVRDAPVLIIDHLGDEYLKGWAYEKLYQLIVYRHNSRLPTIITTPLDLTSSSGPIMSRIRDNEFSQVIRIDAPDRRTHGHPSGTKDTPPIEDI